MKTKRPLRFRLGRILLFPYVQKQWEHYEAEIKKHYASGDIEHAHNCEYICIGITHALTWRDDDDQ